ncbi:putative capsular polysaccharide synthesis family protein [Tateyamaria sp.]|nr:putative capsular polysaccharide synthesis family protein [Tateyamaria sp.]
MVLKKLTETILSDKCINSPDVIIVYTLPKVGQSTMFLSCKQAFPDIPCFRTQNILKKKAAMDLLSKSSTRNIAVITGVREPVSWALSITAQGIHEERPNLISDFNLGKISAREAVQIVREFIQTRGLFEHYETWFAQQASKFTGIDILSAQFDHPRKRIIIANDQQAPQYRILGFRYEDTQSWPDILAEFMGFEQIPIKVGNVALFKEYSLFYYEAVMGISYPMDMLNKLYSSKIIRTFYNDREIKGFKTRWSKPMPDCYSFYIRDFMKKLTGSDFEYIRNAYERGGSKQYQKPSLDS